MFAFLCVFSLSASASAETAHENGPIAWRSWSEDLFETAAKENKLVILDLEAVWCHWCHVMADTTYRDPKVVELINSKFIPVRVDQDANPDISVRYEQWGWPATVLFTADGTEIVKRRGYIPPEAMAGLLEAVIKDPTPGPSILPEAEVVPSSSSSLTPEQKKTLEEEQVSFYDKEYGSWGERLKLIDPNYLEWAFVKSLNGDKTQEGMARQTLDQALNLLDPVWGGFYQYSEDRDWKGPHYEKIMPIQAPHMRLYSLGYLIFKDPKYLDAAKKTAEFVENFWTDPEGGFFVSQDADVDAGMKGKEFYSMDDAARRALGKMPRIDKHVYSRENGWMITGLTALYDASGDEKYLAAAKRSAAWILANRTLEGGGFRHDAEDRAGPYLGDTLAMGQGFLDLYRSDADRKWIVHAEAAARFIEKNFKDAQGAPGYINAVIPPGAKGVFAKPVKQVDENIAAARFANLLYHNTGKTEYRAIHENAMKYLASPSVLSRVHFLCGILIADHEIASDPVHAAVIGAKNDKTARALYKQALAYPSGYKRVEWWDRAEGPLPNPDVEYPEFEKPAAFLCANKACSTPLFEMEKLKKLIALRVEEAANPAPAR